VWDLIVKPELMTRYEPSVSQVHSLTGREGVGAQRWTMVQANGRAMVCEQFTSVWEVNRRVVATLTVGTSRVESEYILVPTEPEQAVGFRDAAVQSTTDVRWSLAATVWPPVLWAVMPFVLFAPLLLMTRIGRRHHEVLLRLGQVAEAEARAGAGA